MKKLDIEMDRETFSKELGVWSSTIRRWEETKEVPDVIAELTGI